MPIIVLYINFIRHFQLYLRLLIHNSKSENVLAHFRKEKTYRKETMERKQRKQGKLALLQSFPSLPRCIYNQMNKYSCIKYLVPK